MQTVGRERVLRALYGAAMGTRPWPEALDRLARYTSTRFVSLDSYDMNRKIGAVLASNMAPDDPVVAEYGRVNGTRNRLIEKAFPHQYTGAILRSSQILPTRKLIETDIYHSLFKPLGMKHAAGITMEVGAGGMTHYSFIKPHDAPDFTDRELALLRDLQPDLTQIWLGFQHLSSLQSQLDSLTTLWNRFSHAVVVTNNWRRIRFANRAAERLFETGGMIVSRNGALHGGSPAVDARVKRAFGSLINEHRHMIRLTTKDRYPPAGPTATLFRLDSEKVVMIVTNSDKPDQDFRTMLQQCYPMTATEADLAQAIVQGQSLRDYSDEHAIAYETARTHLKSVMKKNGWRRQGEMISEILHALLPAGAYGSAPGERS